jgi:cyclopropane fatty-acyl-phospholipid synthase-like methyltransferase
MDFIAKLSEPSRPLAEHQTKANEQHYEVPTSFLQLCLGPRMKYSSCYYPSLEDTTRQGGAKDIKYAKETLAEAEEIMLKSYCDKAGLGEQGPDRGEGLSILDLGCGWGSLGLYLAEKYPRANIKMLSNSRTQKVHIDETCRSKGFNNVEVRRIGLYIAARSLSRHSCAGDYRGFHSIRLRAERAVSTIRLSRYTAAYQVSNATPSDLPTFYLSKCSST